MEKFEYIKWFVKDYNCDMAPVLIYEVDLENERYATRMVEIYEDKRIIKVEEPGFEFITEAPIPTIQEINEEYPDFFAELITKEDFETIYSSDYYNGEIKYSDNISCSKKGGPVDHES